MNKIRSKSNQIARDDCASENVVGQQLVVDKQVPHQTGYARQQQRREELQVNLNAQLTTQVSVTKKIKTFFRRNKVFMRALRVSESVKNQ